jgi:hypothetical protein
MVFVFEGLCWLLHGALACCAALYAWGMHANKQSACACTHNTSAHLGEVDEERRQQQLDRRPQDRQHERDVLVGRDDGAAVQDLGRDQVHQGVDEPVLEHGLVAGAQAGHAVDTVAEHERADDLERRDGRDL